MEVFVLAGVAAFGVYFLSVSLLRMTLREHLVLLVCLLVMAGDLAVIDRFLLR